VGSDQSGCGSDVALTWSPDGIPVSTRFGDPYFSLDGGLDETRHVFLAGNGLPARFRDGFHIAELGFGTGLNLLAAWEAWERAGIAGRMSFTSFEASPLAAAQMRRALAAFPELSERAAALEAAVEAGAPSFALGAVDVRLVIGDVAETLPVWAGQADAWFLDGFAPALNPAMWAEEVLSEVARHSEEGATFATYTAAGHVRRALEAAGFAVERRAGFGRKRHMSAGTLR
jgi:tRNA U34 5-methylaminomethyl-2-thiouridine-forming methyltransferase MnmC